MSIAQAVYLISDDDLVENGGHYKVVGRIAIPIHGELGDGGGGGDPGDVDVTDLTTDTGSSGQYVKVAPGGGLQYRSPSGVRTDLEVVTQEYIENIFMPKAGGQFWGPLSFDPTEPDASVAPNNITEAQRDGILNPLTGLVIYNTDADRLEVYNGTEWVQLLAVLVGVTEGNIPIFDAGGSLVDSGQAPKSLVDGTNVGELVFTDTDNDVSAELVGGILTPGEYGTDGPLIVTVTEHGLVSAIEEGTPSLTREANIVTLSSSRALTAGDAGSIIEATAGATITLPNGLPQGFQVAIVNIDGSTITIAATGTLQSKAAADTITAQYGMATTYHRGSNVWLLAGDIE